MIVRLLRQMGVGVLVVLISACISPSIPDQEKRRQAVEQARPQYANNAIRLEIRADSQLNAFNNIPNSSTVLVVQAGKKEYLDQLLESPVLLRHLFSTTGATEKILQLDRYIMMPGQNVSLHIDRAEQARYIAIIAGYYPAPSKEHSRISSLPLQLHARGWRWINRSYCAEFITAYIRITLGKFAITNAELLTARDRAEVLFP